MKNIALIVVAMIVVSIASAMLGARMVSRTAANGLGEIQAELAFNHLETYKQVYDNLNKKCINTASITLQQAIDEQMMLIAEYIQQNKNEKFEEYVNLRDPILISQLKANKVDWGKIWEIPNCN